MAILAGLLLACSAPALGQSVSGPAEASDGDSLSLSGIRVRLFGIDAPEARQTCNRAGAEWACGEDARARLAQLVEGKSISCESQGIDQYGRMVAICHTGSMDLAEAMVAAGLATAFTKYSDAYVKTENRAKQLKLGLWSSSFEEPAQWRKGHPQREPKTQGTVQESTPDPTLTTRDSLGRCAIKGNHSRRGDWIYHLPGQPYYNETRPEAWFCSENEARMAGYRPSRAR